MAQYITRQGDTWDVMAKRLYGDEHFMDVLIKANVNHRKTVVFSYGVTIEVPEIDTKSKLYQVNLPPWKRSGGSA